MPVEISAPVLMRSPVLTDIDLVALIGRHGLPHARAIGARKDLDERIAKLVASISTLEQSSPDKAEETRNRLRAMMQPAVSDDETAAEPILEQPAPYETLKAAALSGRAHEFYQALSELLQISSFHTRHIVEANERAHLLAALSVLSLSEEQAFLIWKCVRPQGLHTASAISDFIHAYAQIRGSMAQRIIDEWRKLDQAVRAGGEKPELKAS